MSTIDTAYREQLLDKGREALIEFLGPRENHIRNLLGEILTVASVAKGSNLARFYRVYPKEAGGKDAFIGELPEHLIATAFGSKERLEVLKESIGRLSQGGVPSLPDYVSSSASDLIQKDPHVLERYHLRPYVADRGPACEGISLYLGIHIVSMIKPNEFMQMDQSQQQHAASVLLRDLDMEAVISDQPIS